MKYNHPPKQGAKMQHIPANIAAVNRREKKSPAVGISMSFRRRKLSPPDTRRRFERFCTPSFTAADGGKYIESTAVSMSNIDV